MKRFYAAATACEDGTILLDGRAVRTPGRAPLTLPTPALAAAVAAEWQGQGETIDIKAMPLTALAYDAIDRAGPDGAAFADGLAAYAGTDLLCYRADAPPALVAAEAAAWDPLLDWARDRYDVRFEIVAGIVHRAQPAATVGRLGDALRAHDAFALAALKPLITIGGSLVTALAVAEGAAAADAAFAATHVDEIWQAERWGEDFLAAQARAAKRAEFLAAARFLSLACPRA